MDKTGLGLAMFFGVLTILLSFTYLPKLHPINSKKLYTKILSFQTIPLLGIAAAAPGTSAGTTAESPTLPTFFFEKDDFKVRGAAKKFFTLIKLELLTY